MNTTFSYRDPGTVNPEVWHVKLPEPTVHITERLGIRYDEYRMALSVGEVCNPNIFPKFKNSNVMNPILEAFQKLHKKNTPAKRLIVPRNRLIEIMEFNGFIKIVEMANLEPVSKQIDHLIGYMLGTPYTVGDRFELEGENGEIIAVGRKTLGGLIIMVKSRVDPLWNITPGERQALYTLRDMISESEFRSYLKNGFLSIEGKSGKKYQVFRERSHIKVWENGRVVEEICVRIKEHKIPQTDNIIAFKTIIETDENEIRQLGNVYKMGAAA